MPEELKRTCCAVLVHFCHARMISLTEYDRAFRKLDSGFAK